MLIKKPFKKGFGFSNASYYGGSGNVPFAIDGGSTVAETTISSTPSLTTANGSGVIVIGLAIAGIQTAIISGPGLSFTPIGIKPLLLANTNNVYMWTAPYSSNFSGNITVTLSGSVYHIVSVLAISGAKTSSPNDAGGPVDNTSAAPTMTTLNANDCVVSFFETNGVAASAGSGWTGSPGSVATNFGFMEYQFAVSTGTFTSSMSAGTIAGGTITGIQKGP